MGIFLVSFFGSNVFQSCSNRFSKGSPAVPNTFTIAPQINPIWDAQSSTEKVGLPIGKCVCLYFVTGVQRGDSIGGIPNVPKNIDDRSINMAPLNPPKKETKKKL